MAPPEIPVIQSIFRGLSIGGFDACWEWQGSRDRDGYGKLRGRMAHRVIYERLRGPVPKHLTLDHLCRNRACGNPRHLEIVTAQENLRRGKTNGNKTHCPRGHPYDAENTYIRPDGSRRDCRPCHSERSRDSQRLIREQARAAKSAKATSAIKEKDGSRFS